MTVLPDLRFRELGMLVQRQRDVLADGEAVEQRRELKREADLLPRRD